MESPSQTRNKFSDAVKADALFRQLSHEANDKKVKADASVLEDAVFDLDASSQLESNVVVDRRGGMGFGQRKISIDNGVACWDLSNSYMERLNGKALKETQNYTHAYLLKWRKSDNGWRTLLRHRRDHCGIVKDGQRGLGMFSNRNGMFRPCGFDINPQQGCFEVVVITGECDTATSSIGTSTFYVEDPFYVGTKMQMVGTADRVACGQDYYRIGWAGQGPGKIARVLTWQRKLSTNEIDAVARMMRRQHIYLPYHRVWYRLIARSHVFPEQQLINLDLDDPGAAAMLKFFGKYPGLQKLVGSICVSYCRPLTAGETEAQQVEDNRNLRRRVQAMTNQITKLQTDHKALKDMVMRLTASLSTEGSVSTGNLAQPPRAPTELSRLIESAIVDSDSKAIISKRLNQLEIFSPGTLVAGAVYVNFREFKTDMHLDAKVKALGQVTLMRLWCIVNNVVMP